MCIICLELEKMTWPEAVNNLYEMAPSLDDEHVKEVGVKLAMDLFENIGTPEFDEQVDNDLFVKRGNQLFDLLENLDLGEVDFDFNISTETI
jgi:hypothetical protein